MEEKDLQEVENPVNYKLELENQKKIAYTAGLLQGDITIKTLLESLAEGVVIINESGKIVLINDRLAKLTGYNKQEVMGANLSIFIPEPLHEKHNSNIKEYFKDPHIRPMGKGMELIAERKDKTTFPVEISLSFLKTESGMLGIGFLTDITSRKKAEDELKERNIELDAYAHTVAHDLSSSLLGMVGYSELLLNPSIKISEEEHQNYLREIAKSGRKMTTIIRELLLFASMKKEDIEYSEVRMDDLIANSIVRLRFQIEEKSAEIRYENILNCQGYAPWIEEIWFNYISNAIKYGGNPLVIEISSSKTEDGFIKYSVKDNGVGMSEELKKIAFDESNKTKDKLKKGTGFGLSIVKKIIDKLDGHVSIESEEGKGSTFSFYLKENLSESK